MFYLPYLIYKLFILTVGGRGVKKEGTKGKRMLALSLATVTLGVLIAISALVLLGCSTKITNEAETHTDKPANLVTVYKPFG